MKRLLFVIYVLCAVNTYAEDAENEVSSVGEYRLVIERSTVGPLMHMDWWSDGKNIYFSHGLAIGFGYQRDEHFYYGGGIELRHRPDDWEQTQLCMPVYAECRISLSDNKVSPYVGLKIGGNISLIKDDGEYYRLYQSENGKWFHRDFYSEYKLKGFFLCPEFGVRVRRVGIGLSFPIMTNVKEMEVFDSQFKSMEVVKERTLDYGANLSLSFFINL